MINIQEKKDCCGCNACVQRCPKQCIRMLEDNEGFLYPQVDESVCVDCGLCEKVCPVINQGDIRQPIEVYAAKNPDEEIRRQSSSGGIFTMFAERTIDNGGVVFGAAFNENWEVVHRYTETKEGIAVFRGSKYVQSCIGETFKQAEAFLKQGREVLFSGTPCQIAGLKNFLHKEYKNLLAVDFICHGVPSPGVFRTYLNEKKEKISCQYDVKENDSSGRGKISEAKSEVQIDSISFRDKRKGWKKYSFVIGLSRSFVDGEKETMLYSDTVRKNPFLRGFLADLYLRPSCHFCPTKDLKSGSDITIADYWRIYELMPHLDDDKGISAILVNTEKGKLAFYSVSADKFPASYEDVRLKNSAICKSSPIPHKRKDFFTSTTETFTQKIERLLRPTFLQQLRIFLYPIKHNLKKILRK